MPELDYSEKIEFSDYGIRMAVLKPNGRVTHHDNWELDMFGGVLPAVGDHITTLWDPDRPDPAESYKVINRHWIGELKGDNCWWLLLKEVQPTPVDRLLFDVARDQPLKNGRLVGAGYADLVEIRTRLEQKATMQKERETKRATIAKAAMFWTNPTTRSTKTGAMCLGQRAGRRG